MDRFDQLLSQQINRTLERGALFSAMLGLGCAMLIAILEVLGLVQGMWVPALWAGLGGLYSLLPYYLARARLMRGPVTYAVFLPYISLPSLLFLLSAWLLPAGAATFISGPASYLYLFVLIMAGFLFNRRLCFWGGLLVGPSISGPIGPPAISWRPSGRQTP